jgi:phosphatidylglycerol:prolipoprotein diacylglycerol transferase
MIPAILMPAIDPVIVQVGPFAIRWYALAYVAGLLLGWYYARKLVENDRLWSPAQARPTALQLDDMLVYAALGVVLGGRLGHVLVYGLPYYMQNPLEIVQVWKGGMAFHGGLVGVILAIFIFSRRGGFSTLSILDVFAVVAPLGLFFGRIANFINQELWGRVTDVPWGVIFRTAGLLPRHPSQLYEAALEGLLLLLVLGVLVQRVGFRRPGLLAGVFGMGYGLARIVSEFFRDPDPDSEKLAYGLTMGMLLSLPMVLAGLALLLNAMRRPPLAAGEALR